MNPYKTTINVESILKELGINYTNYGHYVKFPCPIHHGDNEGACSVLLETGVWQCFSRDCHSTYGSNIDGFIKGFLKNNTNLSSDQIRVKCAEILNGNKTIIPIDNPKSSYINFINQLNITKKTQQYKKVLYNSREEFRQKYTIPSPYYLQRGFSREILNKYDVGLSKHNKSVIPIYDLNYKHIIGETSRSNYEKCPLCKFYHNPSNRCPTTKEEKKFLVKWFHHNFKTNNNLFNLWFARKEIIKSKTAILVEGCGDALKLIENGIINVVGLFGCDLKSGQDIILKSLGVLNLIVLLDNDEAGIIAMAKLKNRLNRQYRLFFPKLDGVKDCGELNKDQISNELKPYINQLQTKV
jgi:5S rRNA maturation endonuclease (ribonuclease M5)